MKKYILSTTILILIFSCDISFASFENFPAFGICNATNVRVREDPDSSSGTRVVARLDIPERVVVLSQTFVDGDSWYEIDMAVKNHFDEHNSDYVPVESAWVFGKFISALYENDRSDENIISLLTYLNRNSIKNNSAVYDKGWLLKLKISKGNIMPGNLKINDSYEKLKSFLGKPDRIDGETVSYRADNDTYINFTIKNNRIHELNLHSKI